MLVGGARIVGHLHDAIVYLCCGLPKPLGCNSFRSWYRSDQRIPVERIKLIERNDRNDQAIAHLGWGQRAAHPDNEIDIARTGVRAERLDEQICVSGIARD